MSSRKRLYLSLKAGIVELFKTPAHYLKEIVGKQSLFEKPYLVRDYRAMHLNLSTPTWKRPELGPGGMRPEGMWPKEPGKSYWSQFIFQEGKCSFHAETGECGELIKLDASIDQLCMGPRSGDTTYVWNAASSNQELAIIQPIEQHLFGASATIPIQLSEENSGTVTICVTAQIASGSFIKEIRFPVPLPWWDPKYDYRWQILRYMLANVFPSKERRLKDKLWDCGCVDLEVECACTGASWDTAGSAETVAAGLSCAIAITDVGAVKKTWSVSGTGFWLDAGFTITSLETVANSIVLYTDASACGSATITVCGTTGYVRCTTGLWAYKGTIVGLTGLADIGPDGERWYQKILDYRRQKQRISDSNYVGGYSCGDYTICADNCANYGFDGTMGLTMQFDVPGQPCVPNPMTFAPCYCYQCPTGFYCYYTRGLYYHEWECAP